MDGRAKGADSISKFGARVEVDHEGDGPWRRPRGNRHSIPPWRKRLAWRDRRGTSHVLGEKESGPPNCPCTPPAHDMAELLSARHIVMSSSIHLMSFGPGKLAP